MSAPVDSTDPKELYEMAWRARYDNRFDLAHELFMKSLTCARQRDDKHAIGNVLLALSNNLLWHSPPETLEWDDCDAMVAEAMECFRQIGDERGIAKCLRAQSQYDESLEICRRIDDRGGVVDSLLGLASWNCFAKESEKMIAQCDEALAIARALENKEVLADVLRAVGIHRSDAADRREIFLEAVRLYRELDQRRPCAETLMICAAICCDDDQDLAEQLWQDARSLWQVLREPGNEATCLDHLADIAAARADQQRADTLRAQSRELAEPIDPALSHAIGEAIQNLFQK